MKSKHIFIFSIFIIFIIYYSIALYADHNNIYMTQTGPLPEPEFKIIDKWRGTWDVKVIRHQPKPTMEITYVETSEWILDGRFLRSETSQKSDGGKSMAMIWFDNTYTKSYRFVIFDSPTGLMLPLPSPIWDESTQTMKWKRSLFSPVSFTGYTTFINQDTFRWKGLLKDWKGTVILDAEGTNIRRK